jgi:hypothetical protein
VKLVNLMWLTFRCWIYDAVIRIQWNHNLMFTDLKVSLI